ncbi:MAG: hypothetical protein ABR956_12955, partial [Terracidiphilus sp.]
MLKLLKKLNGWQRIGVALSVAWVLYGAYWGNEYGLHQGDWVFTEYNTCVSDAEQKASNTHYSQPEQEQSDINACIHSRDSEW